MKFRKDFVTNSSSSSYVCEICGNTASGWDISYEEAEMFECVNGHVMCQEHMIDVPREEMMEIILENDYYDRNTKKEFRYTKEELEQKDDDELFKLCSDYLSDLPECFCPICQFEEYSESDMAQYLQKEYGIPREEVFAIVKEKNKRRRKLYDSEYITYVAKKFDVDISKIPGLWKDRFKTYAEFFDYINKVQK